MPSKPFETHAAEADAVADAVCFRRVVNAFGTMMATWLICGLVRRYDPDIIGNTWWYAVPVMISGLATWFAAWAIFFGDRRVWSRAFRRAARAARSDR